MYGYSKLDLSLIAISLLSGLSIFAKIPLTILIFWLRGKVDDAFYLASENGYYLFVRLLLVDKRVDPSANDNCAIQWASCRGHVEIIRLLLADSRVDPTAAGNLALRLACFNYQHEAVKLLLQDPRVDASKVITTDSEFLEILAQWKYHPCSSFFARLSST